MIKRFSSRPSLRHEINMTPFVDVMLVLLVIFMVATPMMQSGVPLDLPQGSSSAPPASTSLPVTLSLDPQGDLFLGDQKLPLSQVISALQVRLQGSEERIHIRAHRALAYEKVIALVSLLAARGFTKVVLVTDQMP